MALESHEVDAMLYVLEKHFGEPCLPMSVFKDILAEWVDMVEETYATEEDVPEWVLHLNRTKQEIESTMLFEDQCVVLVESK